MTNEIRDRNLRLLADAYTKAVRDGHAPRGVNTTTGRRSAISVAQEATGLSKGQRQRVIELLDRQHAGWDKVSDEKPLAPRYSPIEPDAADRREVLSLRDELARAKKALRDLDMGHISTERILQMIGYIRENPQPVPDWASRRPDDDVAAGPGIPIFHWTDWHIGETVLPEEVYSKNEFNAEVADERVRALVEKSLYLTFEHVVNPRYPGAVIILGGDAVSGQLHEELLATDWCPPTVAAGWCISRKAWAIREMLGAFERLVVVCVPGNHGRLAKRPWAKRAATACFDHLIYAALREMFADDDRITWVIPPDGEALIQVAGTRYLVMHGHELGVKGGDGIIGALGPITRGATKVGRAERSVGRDFDVLVLGHFHQDLWLPSQGVIVSNTFKGFDEYARRERYRFSPAAQNLWFSHPKWGPNLPFSVFLQDPPVREPVSFVALESAA
ncbi:hypothetical protein [Falsiroseomonas sp. CW058]|uniref:hypothetical protein n=1 Tax=Falsiroseomonas sp. CW058 TaxID=3388664 RepID=UPI003D31F931